MTNEAMTDDAPTKHAGGRPTDYRPEYCEMVVTDMAQGYSLGAFAGLIGVSRRTLTEWMAVHKEFSLAVSRGKAVRLRQWEDAALKGATTQQGGNATLIVFGLKNAGRAHAGEEDEWAEKTEFKHSGAIDVGVKAVDEIASQLASLAARERAESDPGPADAGEG